MSNKKKIIAVAEMSYVIRKGFVYVLSQMDIVSKVIELDNMDNIKYELDIHQPHAVLINPMLLGQASKQDIRQQLNLTKETKIIALVYNLLDERFYTSYDAVVKINDSKARIRELISDCLKDETDSGVSDQEELSDREKEILISLVKGRSNKEVADHLNISIHTAITHRRNITRKLKVHSISGLTIYAIINKLIDISEIQYQEK